MSTPFNRQIIIGRVAEIRVIHLDENDNSQNDVRLIVNSTQNDKVVSHEIRVSGKLANVVNKHLHEKDLICVEGRIGKSYILAERCTFLGMANLAK